MDKELTLKNWSLALDPQSCGKEEKWYLAVRPEAKKAYVPGFVQDTFEEYRSGAAWFYAAFDAEKPDEDTDCFLKLGFTEYVAEFWLNGSYLGRFDGRMLFYEFDCTAAMQDGENLLAIRIFSPGMEEAEGYRWNDVPYVFGSPESSPAGGILYPVRVACRPKLRVEVPVVKTDIHTGIMTVDVALHNGYSEEHQAVLVASVLSPFGENCTKQNLELSLPCGETSAHLELLVENPFLWSTDEPNLYNLSLMLLPAGKCSHEQSLKIGYRECMVKDGWFHMNGKRMLMKGSFNTEGFHPMGAILNNKLLEEELIQAKAMGFNTLRYHNNAFYPEILDICDQIGLAVVSGHGASWHIREDNRYMEEQFDKHLIGTVKHDINRTCIVGWEMVNESHQDRERNHVVEALQTLRDVDMTRMVFLGSGRWDREMSIGSISNPGSRKWDCVFGAEDPDAPPAEKRMTTCFSYGPLGSWTTKEEETVCWQPDLGDVHIYLRIPMTQRGKWILRNHAKDVKPAIVTEFGVATIGKATEALRRFEQIGMDCHNRDIHAMEKCAESMEQFWKDYRLGDQYAFPRQLIQASCRETAYTRKIQFDLLRANPKLAGYLFSSLAGQWGSLSILDWYRQRLPYLAEMVTECYAPLHWCVFVEPGCVYAGEEFTVEAVLANEDVLKPGTYPVSARIVSPEHGCLWEYHTEFTIEKPAEGGYQSLCENVFKQTVKLDAPAGEYTCAVYLEKGGQPTGGMQTILVAERPKVPDTVIDPVCVSDETLNWLKAQGVKMEKGSSTILIGDQPCGDETWSEIEERVKAGAKAVVTCPEVMLKDVEDPYDYYHRYPLVRFPVEKQGKLLFSCSWAFRMHTVLKNTRFAAGMPVGLLRDQYYDQTEPLFVLCDSQMPDELGAVSLNSPYTDMEGDEVNGSLAGVALGSYKVGKGELVVNCFRILSELGKSPAADTLLLNLIR